MQPNFNNQGLYPQQSTSILYAFLQNNPSQLQQAEKTQVSSLIKEYLKMSYHEVAQYRCDNSLLDFPNLQSFDLTMLHLETISISKNPLSIHEDLNLDHILRFIIFRFWIASARFPRKRDRLKAKYKLIVTHLLEKQNLNTKDFSLQKCLLWHLSRGLLESKSEIVEKTLYDLASVLSVHLDADDFEFNNITQFITGVLQSFGESKAFEDALKKFGIALGKEPNSDDLKNIIEKLKDIKIVAMQVVSENIMGMALPNGFALNLEKIKKFAREEQVPHEEAKTEDTMEIEELEEEQKDAQELQENSEDDKKNAEEFHRLFFSIALWISVHELGHFLIRTKELSSELYFGKLTPPSKSEDEGIPYENLEGGFLFSSIFLGTFSKKIWKVPELIDRLFDLKNVESVPIFTPEELKDLPRNKILNIRNSGVISLLTGNKQSMML